MAEPTDSDFYKQSELLDVHVIDLLAEAESLIRHVRELQKGALRVRGIPNPVTPAQRMEAATGIQERLGSMRDDCRTLSDAVRDAQTVAQELVRTLTGSPTTRRATHPQHVKHRAASKD